MRPVYNLTIYIYIYMNHSFQNNIILRDKIEKQKLNTKKKDLVVERWDIKKTQNE